VDATITQIDNEIAQSNEIRGYLSDKRDKAVNRANLLSIVSAGTLGATSAGLELPSGENKASSIVVYRGHRRRRGLLQSGDLRHPGAEGRIQTWITVKRTDPPSTSAGKDRIDRVTSQPSDKLPLTIDDLEDRSAMLEDVRAKVSFLKRNLVALLLSLPEEMSPPIRTGA